jgi:cytochrome c556
MRRLVKCRMLGLVAVMAVSVAAVAAPAPNKDAVLKERQATMKQQAKDLGGIKGYLDGKTDQAAALAGAESLTRTTRKIPSLFPPGTEAPSPDGKYGPKPAVWTEWSKFLDRQKTAQAKADALLVAVKSGEKPQIQHAFVDLGKNGCGACHTDFRAKLKD